MDESLLPTRWWTNFSGQLGSRLRQATYKHGTSSLSVILTRNTNSLRLAYGQFFIAMAPVVLVGCANIARSRIAYGQRAELYAVQDVTIAASYVQLAAEALGVATCWIGAFDEKRVSLALKIPLDIRPVLMLPIGYPDESPEATVRMEPSRFTHQELWSSLGA